MFSMEFIIDPARRGITVISEEAERSRKMPIILEYPSAYLSQKSYQAKRAYTTQPTFFLVCNLLSPKKWGLSQHLKVHLWVSNNQKFV